jgi:cold shock CspA family protein
MAVGTIKNLISGFGFILPEGAPASDRNLFFQRYDLKGTTYEALHVGQDVEYEVVKGQAPGMLKASDVRIRQPEWAIENIH